MTARPALTTAALVVAVTASACTDDAPDGPPPSASEALATVCGDAETAALDAGPYDDYDGATVSDTRTDLASCSVAFEFPTDYYGAGYGEDPTADMEEYADSAQKSDGGDVAYAIAGTGDTWTVVWVIEPQEADLDRFEMLEDDGFEISRSDQS